MNLKYKFTFYKTMVCQRMIHCAVLVLALDDITGSGWEGLDVEYGEL